MDQQLQLVGSLTLRSEGVDPSVHYTVVINSGIETIQDMTHLIADIMAQPESVLFFVLDPHEHGEDSFIIVPAERIRSLIIQHDRGVLNE